MAAGLGMAAKEAVTGAEIATKGAVVLNLAAKGSAIANSDNKPVEIAAQGGGLIVGLATTAATAETGLAAPVIGGLANEAATSAARTALDSPDQLTNATFVTVPTKTDFSDPGSIATTIRKMLAITSVSGLFDK